MVYEIRLFMALEHPMAQVSQKGGGVRGRIQIDRDNQGRLMTVHTLWGGRNIQRAYLRRFAQLGPKEPCGRPEPIHAGPRLARWVLGPCRCAGRLPPCRALHEAIEHCQQALPGRSRLDALEFAQGEITGLATYYERHIPSPDHADALVARPLTAPETGPPGPPAGLDPLEARTLREAVRLGYYDRPRRIHMEDLANTLGITKSAVCRRLNKLERTAVVRLLDDLSEHETAPRTHEEWMKDGMIRKSRHPEVRASA